MTTSNQTTENTDNDIIVSKSHETLNLPVFPHLKASIYMVFKICCTDGMACNCCVSETVCPVSIKILLTEHKLSVLDQIADKPI